MDLPPPLVLSPPVSPNGSTQFDVFISYNRDFDSQVKTLYYELTVTHELSVWLDEFETMPTSLTDEVSKGILISKVFLCCLSKKYCESSFCMDELLMANRLKKKIAVLMLEKLNDFELGRLSLIVHKFTNILVYEHKNKLLEPSNSELYNTIIHITRFKLNEADHQVLEEFKTNLNNTTNSNVPQSNSPLQTVRSLNSHSGAIYAVTTLTNDRVASGSEDTTIKIWDITTYDLIKTLYGHTENVTNLKAVCDEKLVSGSNDSSIIIWNLITYEQIRVLKGHTGSISCIKELPEKNLATCSYDSTIRIWCLHTYNCLKTIEKYKSKSMIRSLMSRKPNYSEGHSKPIFCLKITSLDSRLVSGSGDSTIKVWDINDYNCITTLNDHKDLVISLKNLSQNRMASASFDKTIKIWDMSNYVCMQTLTGHTAEIQCLTVLPNNQLASGGCDYTIRIWNLNGINDCIRTFKAHTKNVNIIKQMGNNRLISFSNDNQIKLWDFKSLKLIETYNEHIRCVSSVSLINTKRIVSGSWDKSVKVWTFY